MMNCQYCGDPITHSALICQRCLAQKFYRELLAQQSEYLLKVAGDRLDLRLARLEGTRHVLLFRSRNLTWCGMTIQATKDNRSERALAALPSNCCGRCVEELTKALEQLKAGAHAR